MFKCIQRVISTNLKQRCSIHTTSIANVALINISEKNGVREITLNQPKNRNALSFEMMESIIEGLTKNVHDDKLRCIVLSSTGPVFSSGHNLRELTADHGQERHREIFQKCAEMISKINCAPVPVIAKVDGLAAAAGCQLVASCDILVCSESSSFSTPGANFGLFCHTPGIAIGRAMPRMKSSYMLLTGLPISAQEAYVSGLVSVVTKSDKLDDEVTKICDAIKNKSRRVIAMGKEFYYRQLGLNIRDAYVKGSEIMVENLGLNDGKEGVKSFVTKKKPAWTHS